MAKNLENITGKDLQNMSIKELRALDKQLSKPDEQKFGILNPTKSNLPPTSKSTYRNGDREDIEYFGNVGYRYGLTPPINAECTTVLELQSGIDNDAGINNKNTIQQTIDNASINDVICITSPSGDSYAIQGSIFLNKSSITLKGREGGISLWFYEYNENYINNIGPSDGIIIGHEGELQQSLENNVTNIDQNGNFTVDYSFSPPYSVGDYVKIEVEIGTSFITYYNMEHYADLYSVEDTTNWNPGWKEFAIRKIMSVDSATKTFYVDIPFRYPISLDIFDNIRVSKVSPKTNIGLEMLTLSNAVYYDDAWKKGSSYEIDVLSSSFNLNLTSNNRDGGRDLDPCLMDCGYTEDEINEKLMLAIQFDNGNYTNINEFCVWVDDLVTSGCLSDCPGECEYSENVCYSDEDCPDEICENLLYLFTGLQGECENFGIFGFESDNKHLIKMNGCVDCFVHDIRSGTIGNDFYEGIGYSEPGSSIGTMRCPPQFIDNDGDVTNYLLTDLFDKLDYKASVNESLSECQTHSDCPHYDEVDSGWGYFCHSGWDGNEYGPRYCQQYSGNPADGGLTYPLGLGDGDCGNPGLDGDCAPGLVCNNDLNNCGNEFASNTGTDGNADCCTPDEHYCDETILTSFDNIMDGLNLPHDRMNVTNEIRHIVSNGIKIENSKNVTIQNISMKLPSNRGNEKNGLLYNIDKSNEILIQNCEGYRGRRNFVVGGWGTSGLVFSRIASVGGWGFGINISDLLSQIGIAGTNIFESHLFYYNSTAPLTSWSSPQEFEDRWDMGQVENPNIIESSGLIHSRKNSSADVQYNPNELYGWDTNAKHILWTHNDHVGGVEDGVGILYAINAHGAKNVGKFYPTVNGQQIYKENWNNDWEDIAIGPPPDAHKPGGCALHEDIYCTTWPEEEEQCDYYCECDDGDGFANPGHGSGMNPWVTWCESSGGPYDNVWLNCIDPADNEVCDCGCYGFGIPTAVNDRCWDFTDISNPDNIGPCCDPDPLETCSGYAGNNFCEGFCDNCEGVLGGTCEENEDFGYGSWQPWYTSGCDCYCKEDCQMVTYPHYNTMDCFQSGGCMGQSQSPHGCETSCEEFCYNHYGITFSSPTAGQGKCRVRLNGEINDDGTVTPSFANEGWQYQITDNCTDNDPSTPCTPGGRMISWLENWNGNYQYTCEQYARIYDSTCHEMFTENCTIDCNEIPEADYGVGDCPVTCYQPNGQEWPNYDDIVAGNVESNCPNCNSNDQSGCDTYLVQDGPCCDGWYSVKYDWCWEYVSEEMNCEWLDLECGGEEQDDCPWDVGIQTVESACVVTDTGQTCEDFGYIGCNDGKCTNDQCDSSGMGYFSVPSTLSACNCQCCGEEELGNELNYLPGEYQLKGQQDVLYIGDIGDNKKLRDVKHIFRCPEPDIESPGIGDVTFQNLGNVECDVLKFKYGNPDCDSLSHSHLYPVDDTCSESQYIKMDAETLMVDPSTSKNIYIISKGESIHSVWELENPVNLDEDEILTAHYVGTIKDLWANPWTKVNQITGGDISTLGTEIIIKTYGAVFTFNRYINQTVGEALNYNEPTNVTYIPEQMGEAIALDSTGSSWKSKGYFTLSEETTPNDLAGGLDTSVLDVDSDFWSRYGKLELMSLFFGYNGFSATTKAMSNSILVTDSDIYDGWFSVNREGLFGGRGHSTTNTVFWNVRGNPNPDTEEPWKDMAVPGMSALASFQPSSHNTSTPYENGGLLVDTENMNIYTESENGKFTDYYDYSTNILGSFFDVAEFDVVQDIYGVQTDIYTGQSFEGGDYVNNTMWFITNLIESMMQGTFDYLNKGECKTGEECSSNEDCPTVTLDGDEYGVGGNPEEVGVCQSAGGGWLAGLWHDYPECCIDEESGASFSGFGCPKQDEDSVPCVGMCDGRKSILFVAKDMGYQPECSAGWQLSDYESGFGGMCLGLSNLTFGVPEIDITMNENKDITVNITVEDSAVVINGYVWKCGPNWGVSGGGSVGALTYSNTFIAQYQGEGNNEVLVGYLPQETDYTITTNMDDIGYWFDLDLFASGLLSPIWNFIIDLLLDGAILIGELAEDVSGDYTGTSVQDIVEATVAPKVGEALHNNLTNGFAVLLNEFKFLSLIRFGTLQTINFTLGTDGSHYQTGNSDTVESDGSIPNLYEAQLGVISGDSNYDGIVNVIDIVAAVSCVLNGGEIGSNEGCYPMMDINGDGVVNIVDIVGIVDIALSGGVRMSSNDMSEITKQLNRLIKSDISTKSEKQQLKKELKKIFKLQKLESQPKKITSKRNN